MASNNIERQPTFAQPEINNISKTADLIAYLRTFSDIPYSKEISNIAHLFNKYKKNFGVDDQESIFRAPRFEARFKSVTNLLKKYGTKNIVELASGLSPRGLILSEDTEINYLETDYDILEKKEVIEKITAGNKRPNLKLKTLNVLDEKEILQLANEINQPLTIISEGLLVYLNFEEQKRLAVNVHAVLKERGGMWITPDFATKEDRQKSYGAESGMQIEKVSNINIRANSFDNNNQISQFFIDCKLKATIFDQRKEAGDIISGNILHLDTDQLEKRLSDRKVYILTAI